MGSRMNYNKLLNTKEWQNKRNHILSINGHQCARCGARSDNQFQSHTFKLPFDSLENVTFEFLNNSVYNNTNFILVNGKEANLPHLCRTKISSIESQVNYSIIINKVDSSLPSFPFDGSNYLESQKDLKKLNYFLHNNTKKEIEKFCNLDKLVSVDTEAIYFIKEQEEYRYLKNFKNLHVHHKCYRKNKEIWNQNDEEYAVLCNVCHQVVHENQVIPFYDSNNRIIQMGKPCFKCNGKGKIEAYQHIDNGVCYQCRGSGFLYNPFNDFVI